MFYQNLFLDLSLQENECILFLFGIASKGTLNEVSLQCLQDACSMVIEIYIYMCMYLNIFLGSWLTVFA